MAFAFYVRIYAFLFAFSGEDRRADALRGVDFRKNEWGQNP